MKPILQSLACAFSIWLLFIASCEKPGDETLVQNNNRTPIANAGKDQSIKLPTCGNFGSTELDGTSSSDADNDSLRYSWSVLSTSTSATLINQNTARPTLNGIGPGRHSIQLRVFDTKGQSSSDVVEINATGVVKEYELDATLTGPYTMAQNVGDCWYTPCIYYDVINVEGATQSQQIGEFLFSIYENSDTAALSQPNFSTIRFYRNDTNSFSIGGTFSPSIDFKKLIQAGGGSFNSLLSITDGTALQCDVQAFNNLSPLSVTGSLDAVTNSIVMRIKGKVVF